MVCNWVSLVILFKLFKTCEVILLLIERKYELFLN